MKKLLLSLVLCGALPAIQGCLPKAGCTDHTAENFDPEAEEWDGSCIPSRDKLIGNYTYTRKWTDVVTATDSVSFGSIAITESSAANNAFVFNLDGQFVLRGVIAAFAIVLDPYAKPETFEGFQFTRTFNGAGEWVLNDTVDAVLAITAKVPSVAGNPPALVETNQLFNYYLSKQ